MSKTAVVYKSTYGFTKKYAQFIAQKLGADLFESNAIKTKQLNNYDLIIYGGGIYASKINGMDLVSKRKDGRLILFTVGLTDPKITDYSEMIKKAFPNQTDQPEKIFHFRGGMDSQHLGFIHRNLMKLLKNAAKNKPYSSLNDIEKIVLDTYGKQVDYTDLNHAETLISYIRKIEN